MRLRPYKSCDALTIEKWIKDESVFLKWGGERVTIGVFENNEPAYLCYKKTGFTDVETVKGEPWNIIEMEISCYESIL